MLSAIVLAAGAGRRLNALVPKPLVKIGKKPAIIYSLCVFNKHPKVDEIIVVLNRQNQAAIKKVIKKYNYKKIKAFVLGGRRRQDSVYNGLRKVSLESGWVLIHDSARPFIDKQAISKVVLAAKKTGAAILGVPIKATIKSTKNKSIVYKTIDRRNLWEIQTPQVFEKEIILKAYRKYSHKDFTDDASLAERLGQKVKVVQGSHENIKITTKEDLLFAELIAKRPLYAI